MVTKGSSARVQPLAKRPTQKDVAELAGVSVATVSHVINNRRGGNVRISEGTRRRVWEAVKELGYFPNASARSLRTQKTHLLAVMVPDITNPFYPELIRGVQSVALKHGYETLVYDCDDRPERERAFVDAMIRRRVDGVILVPFHLQPEDFLDFHRGNIPVAVSIAEPFPAPGVDFVVIDEINAVKQAMAHLIARGHRRIAHITGAMDTAPGRNRLRGYREALLEAGLGYDESLVRYGNFRSDGVAELVASLFVHPAGEGRPTAVFAANDVMAIAALNALLRGGWRVPEDVAVVGFDDIPAAQTMYPALTTVAQDTQLLGRRLAELIMERLHSDEPYPERKISYQFRFVARESA